MNIIFVGFMTSGKSTLGRFLAKKLKWKHIDLDAVCQAKTTMKISEIFEKVGEKTFRQLETYYLKQVVKEDKVIISTGGGIVLNEENRKILKESGFVVWLKTSPEKVLKYSRRNNNRPLLKNKTLQDIEELLEKRLPFYQDSCHFSIDTTQLNLHQLVDIILEEYNKHVNS